MTEECCKNCRYWKGVSDRKGWCVRYPPQMVAEVSISESDYSGVSGDTGIESYWPTTDDDDWCGEFEEKKEK